MTDVNIEIKDLQNNDEEVTKESIPQLSIVDQLNPQSNKANNKKRGIDDEDFFDEDLKINLQHSSLPFTIEEATLKWNLDQQLADILKEDMITHFSTVQKMVIPYLLRSSSRSSINKRDMCVSAPTGSGKTLSYAIPIIQSLRNRTTIRLKALIMLPSRELATQVFRVFSRLCQKSDIKVAIASGQTQFEEEQKQLTGSFFANNSDNNNCLGFKSNVNSTRRLYVESNSGGDFNTSTVDILVCTPGRLLDHLQYSKGFTLKYLSFLVLDEADRLLGNAYHDWVRLLIKSTDDVNVVKNDKINLTNIDENINKINENTSYLHLFPSPKQPMQRLLFSATLTDNPRKLAILGIRNPIIARAQASDLSSLPSSSGGDSNESNSIITPTSGFFLPTTLSESILICDAKTRPLKLITVLLESFKTSNNSINKSKIIINNHKICNNATDMCIIFSSSVDTTHRVCRLLQIINGEDKEINDDNNDTNNTNKYLFGGRVGEMNRLMTSKQRENIMRDAASGKIRVLVSSDHMARGIDLRNIKLVINYDPPIHAKSYIHRVGRTARADRYGHCVTILKTGQITVFHKMRASIGSNNVQQQSINNENNNSVDNKDNKDNVNKNKRRKTDTINNLIAKCKPSIDTESSISTLYQASLKRLSNLLLLESEGVFKLGDSLFADDF
jgi:ATP-dependent RNA helicase DDX51/DBP6